MQRLALLQKSPQRHRGENTVPSTFPERHERAHGDPGKDTDELLGEIALILTEHEHHEHIHEATRRQLCQSVQDSKRPE